MAAFESKLQRLEERLRAPGSTTRDDEIKLQELNVGACYGVREAALKILEGAEAGKYCGPDPKFPERFMQKAEEDLIHSQKILRNLTGDDGPAWEARLARIQAGRQQVRRNSRRRELGT